MMDFTSRAIVVVDEELNTIYRLLGGLSRKDYVARVCRRDGLGARVNAENAWDHMTKLRTRYVKIAHRLARRAWEKRVGRRW